LWGGESALLRINFPFIAKQSSQPHSSNMPFLQLFMQLLTQN
jgi:hypothetical protein